MSNSGIGTNLTLNNCFVCYQVPDDLDGIFECVKLGAKTHKAGGGIGYDFSLIRPAGSKTSNDAIASGPVSFMEVFDTQTSTILQGNRRGANMGVMNIYHPDIEQFITAKTVENKFTHFNLSVMVDDDFIHAVQEKKKTYLHYPVYTKKGKILKDESKWTTKIEVDAFELWEKIMKLAYDNGEPGIFFYDNMNRDNNLYYCENIVASNPCSEYLAGTVFDDNSQSYGGACNLGSLLLHNFVYKPFTAEAGIDIDKLNETIRIAVRMLDNIIDINKFPDKIYENYQKRFRTIGLGVTGLADMLAMLGIKYGSEEALKMTDVVIDSIAVCAYNASCDLAKEKGAFPAYKNDFLKSGYMKKQAKDWNLVKDKIAKYGIRNARILSVAPTGTMSLTFGNNCSSGIEPIFSLEYKRKVKFGGQSDDDIQLVKIQDYAYKKWLEICNKPECIVNKDTFVTALELSVDKHIEMLGSIAKHIDMSVSKTINIPEDYSFENTKDVYLKCWQLGIKGCTIFRPNPLRQGILISHTKKSQEEEKKSNTILGRGDILVADDNVIGLKRKLTSGCGSLHVQAFFDPNTGLLQETYFSKGSTGGCNNFMIGLSRMISLASRAGVGLEDIVDQLNSCGACPSYATRHATKHDTSPGACCPMAIGRALLEMSDEFRDWMENNESNEIRIPRVEHEKQKAKINKCPQCGEELVQEGGCIICKNCGWSKCD